MAYSNPSFRIFPIWRIWAAHCGPDCFVKAHYAEKPSEIAPDPIANEHVVENLNLLVARAGEGLNMFPRSRTEALCVRHRDYKVVSIGGMNRLESKESFQRRNDLRSIAMVIETEGYLLRNVCYAGFIRCNENP